MHSWAKVSRRNHPSRVLWKESRNTSVVPEKDALSGSAFLVFSHTISAPPLQTQGQEIVVAVAMLYVDTEAVVKPLLHPKVFGETSDVVLVDQATRILMPLKYPLADGTRAKVLEHAIETEPVRLSLRGDEGAVISTDYRGMPILAVYRTRQRYPWSGLGPCIQT